MNTQEIFVHAIDIAGGLSKLSRQIGISPAYCWQIKKGLRPIPLNTCVQIERATNGAVTRKDLRPDDWHLIWPELEDKNG